jgi:hypothetical protein
MLSVIVCCLLLLLLPSLLTRTVSRAPFIGAHTPIGTATLKGMQIMHRHSGTSQETQLGAAQQQLHKEMISTDLAVC